MLITGGRRRYWSSPSVVQLNYKEVDCTDIDVFPNSQTEDTPFSTGTPAHILPPPTQRSKQEVARELAGCYFRLRQFLLFGEKKGALSKITQ